MTFEDLKNNLVKRWWWPVVLACLFGLVSISFLRFEKYQAVVTINLSLVEDRQIVEDTLFPNVDERVMEIEPEVWEKLNPDNANRDYVYFRLLGSMGSYFVNRFAGVDAQATIAEDMVLSTDNFSADEPFYEIENNGLGSLTLIYESNDVQKLENFEEAVQTVFGDLVDEWNQEKDLFKISAVDGQIEPVIIKQEPKLQEYILSPFAGLMMGITLAVVVPLRNSKNSV